MRRVFWILWLSKSWNPNNKQRLKNMLQSSKSLWYCRPRNNQRSFGVGLNSRKTSSPKKLASRVGWSKTDLSLMWTSRTSRNLKMMFRRNTLKSRWSRLLSTPWTGFNFREKEYNLYLYDKFGLVLIKVSSDYLLQFSNNKNVTHNFIQYKLRLIK